MLQLGESTTRDEGANTRSVGKVQQWTERMRDVTVPVRTHASRVLIRILALSGPNIEWSLSAFLSASSKHVDLYRRH